MKKSINIVLLVAVTVSLSCGEDEKSSLTSPSYNNPDRPSVNKDLLIASWQLGSLKTILNDGSIIEEVLTFGQTLDFNADLTFDIENQGEGIQVEQKEGQWSSTSTKMQLIFVENNIIFKIEDHEYTVTESFLKLTLVSDPRADGSLPILTYTRK